MKKKLNIDVGGSVTEFKAYAKYLEMKNKLYRSLFRGKGLIFDGFRTYSPDDDAKDIDWKTSARANRIIMKKYKEERELKFIFVVDVSDSMVFGSEKKLKCEYTGEIVAALGNLILESGDKIGLLIYNGKSHLYIPPTRKRQQLNIILNSLMEPNNYGGKSDFGSALEFIDKNLGNKINVVMFFSDFLHFDRSYEKQLKQIVARYETIAFMVKDRLDKTLPNTNQEIKIQNPNTSEQIIINPEIARKKYEKFAAEQEKMVESVFVSNQIDFLELVTDKPFVNFLVEFLEERLLKRKGGIF